ncbi:carbohydrate ABC transporter permease [Nonomuraea jiangxiensis]|uniref:Multiple sugar transport system permease protein/raffinose/stachyose/melibiose transport system permease protein n=1 Tax=Nonomuraea jiangxiensis TaxID=633440 RepID=A0A1G8TEY1_9ACTN|nr:carbohydrate ABC transporter permease [Nonomuraea jiangxiensis]SDJ40152.1 multiple sugar transport system permease protein/raffinose/stachyose/melibiose transport system permease protein [Nonomuraea jiangxiensis]
MRRFAYAGLIAYALISVYPFLWMVTGAFKTRTEILEGNLLPREPTLDTLIATWSRLHFLDYFLNSLKVTAMTVIGVLVVYSLASYAFAVLDFPGRRFLYWFFVALLFVPGITVLLPVVILEKNLGLLGGHLGLVLPFVNGTAPLTVLLLTNSYSSIPRELREAARSDGAGEARIFWSVYLPLARPAHITVAVLTAVPTWNEYVLTRVSLSDRSLFTLPLGLESLISGDVPSYNEVMAASLIIVLPVIALFLLLQRYFINGLTGAIKG